MLCKNLEGHLLYHCCIIAVWDEAKNPIVFMTVFEFYRNGRVQMKLDCVLPSPLKFEDTKALSEL